MANPALLRRLALAALIGAIVSGIVSLFRLLAGGSNDPTFAAVSATLLIVGLIIDRRAGKLDDRNAS